MSMGFRNWQFIYPGMLGELARKYYVFDLKIKMLIEFSSYEIDKLAVYENKNAS